jgi:hypothetical protein
MPEILTDVDGVLLNWEDSFHSWMSSQGFDRNDEPAYQLEKCYPRLNPDFVYDKIRTFNASAWMGYLEPYADALHWVKQLYYAGITFHCITSMGTDYCAGKLRERNLKDLFGPAISGVTILDCGAHKGEALAPYKDSNRIWLEDHIGNANTGSELGLRTFLFNHPYNLVNPTSKLEDFIRIDNWEQLVPHILNK